jgi:Ankyrin repeats (many copies)/Ankyrin repeats (3 copies)
MQEKERALLIYQSIASNNYDDFLDLIIGYDLKWLNSFVTDPEITYLFDCTLPMNLAIEVDNSCVVHKLIEMGEKPAPFLEWAIISGNPIIVKLLIDAASEIQMKNNELLSLASERGNLEIVKILIEKGVDINSYDDDYFWVHPVVKTIANAHIHIYRYLIPQITRHRDILNTIAMQEVARQGDLKTLSFLVDTGMDINAADHLWGSTPLMIAVGAKQSIMVNYLIDMGANINLQDFEGKTALMIAINDSSVTMVKKLLAAGSEKNLKDVNDNTALDLAIDRKNRYIAGLLQK